MKWISFQESTAEVQEPDKKLHERPILSPNDARINLPVYDGSLTSAQEAKAHRVAMEAKLGFNPYRVLLHSDTPKLTTNETKISAEPKKEKLGLSFEAQVQAAQKRLKEDSDNWASAQESIRLMMPENDWRDIPGFSQYEMNRLGAIRGKESKVERPQYVKLWRGGDTEVVIGVDSLKAMTFGVKDG